MPQSGKAKLIAIADEHQRNRWAVIEDGIVVWSGPSKELGEAWAKSHDIEIETVHAEQP